MTAQDVQDEEQELWPENAAAVAVMVEMGTQWRHGMNGVTGLDYGALEAVLRVRRIPEYEWQEIWSGVRTMERAVLEMKAEKNG